MGYGKDFCASFLFDYFFLVALSVNNLAGLSPYTNFGEALNRPCNVKKLIVGPKHLRELRMG